MILLPPEGRSAPYEYQQGNCILFCCNEGAIYLLQSLCFPVWSDLGAWLGCALPVSSLWQPALRAACSAATETGVAYVAMAFF